MEDARRQTYTDGFKEVLGALDELEKPERIGDYTIGRTIGGGGMGTVYEGRIELEGSVKIVAIKLIRQDGIAKYFRERFHVERKALSLCVHPGIIQILADGSTEDGRPYFVMEYLEDALPITDYCERHHVDIRGRVELLRRVCAAVHAAHEKGVVHCDLTPSNILVTRDGTPKIIDFGISKVARQSFIQAGGSNTSPLLRMGSAGYSSPEQLEGEHITERSDIYALGVLLYELVLGRMPYEFSDCTLHEILHLKRLGAPSLPSNDLRLAYLPRMMRYRIDRVTLKALKGDPEERYASVAELGEALASVAAADRFPSSQLKTMQYHLGRVKSRAKIAAAVAAGALVLFTSAIYWGTRGTAEGQGHAQQPVRPASPSTQTKEDPVKAARLEADVMWLVFGSPVSKKDALIDPAVMKAAMSALCEADDGIVRPPESDYQPVSARCTREEWAEGVDQLKTFADEGKLGASAVLAHAYYFGTGSNEVNHSESLKWARISAAKNVLAGQYLLGNHYFEGTGIPKDDKKALDFYTQAAAQGELRSQAKLCTLYNPLPLRVSPWAAGGDYRSLQLPRHRQSVVQAYTWCVLAVSNVTPGAGADAQRLKAKIVRDRISSELSPAQLAAAQIAINRVHAKLSAP